MNGFIRFSEQILCRRFNFPVPEKLFTGKITVFYLLMPELGLPPLMAGVFPFIEFTLG